MAAQKRTERQQKYSETEKKEGPRTHVVYGSVLQHGPAIGSSLRRNEGTQDIPSGVRDSWNWQWRSNIVSNPGVCQTSVFGLYLKRINDSWRHTIPQSLFTTHSPTYVLRNPLWSVCTANCQRQQKYTRLSCVLYVVLKKNGIWHSIAYSRRPHVFTLISARSLSVIPRKRTGSGDRRKSTHDMISFSVFPVGSEAEAQR